MLIIGCRNGRTEFSFRILRNRPAYGVKKAVNQVHELFVSFLKLYHVDYMFVNFDLSEE